ncbi:Methylase [Rhodotorula toruloides ATCC 204091]|uniref:Methylase n=1 Tax=Rhodotorula toruloides TaxID=5286 RepID=A0A0K3CFB4_RHOTO|nr:Methylase [Rhodotorula toruloides ATCC 204091]KAK4335998.1 eRF1 methyltransferase catalytic subunit MTQ2 [Rhodotorula toruloides]PRQ75940.1 methylase [Rhodotorula toruloides]
MIPTPITSHLSAADFETVYEPAEDTFILLDALEQDAELLKGSRVCLEIGSGSGCVSAFLGAICGSSSALYLTTDLNPHACRCTLLTSTRNSVPLNPILTDLTSALLPRLTHQVDILVFNPPYVETEDEEVVEAQKEDGKRIEKSWAGGAGGMRVTNRLLEQVDTLLSDRGLFYLVAVPENKPLAIIADMQARGLEGEVVLKRRAGREHLHVLRFSRPGRTAPP